MDDILRRRYRPEAVTEQQGVGNDEEGSDPEQRGQGDGGSVGAGEHQRFRLPSRARRFADRPGSGSREFKVENASVISAAGGSQREPEPIGTLDFEQVGGAVECLVADGGSNPHRVLSRSPGGIVG